MAKRNIIIIQLMGGLGNQMFQYALARVLASKHKGAEVLIDLSFLQNDKGNDEITKRNFELTVFKNEYRIIEEKGLDAFKKMSRSKRIRRKLNLSYSKVYKEKSYSFQPEIFSINPPVYLQGYFQSYKYFQFSESFVRGLFSISLNKFGQFNLNLLNHFEKHHTVSVHIRRGDYISNSNVQKIHGNCDMKYYLRALNLIRIKIKDPVLVFFSDDIDWVREQFSDLAGKSFFIEHNRNQDSWKDLILMSRCRHNIIANSTFSWWGAWLNTNPGKMVVAPKKWFRDTNMNERAKDLLPSQWIKI